MRPCEILVSVVSHDHASLLPPLLDGLREHCRDRGIAVALTLNTGESLPFGPDGYGFPVALIRNPRPKGFAANHNAAFRAAKASYFCVLNPDIRLVEDPFPPLCLRLEDGRTGVAAPLIVNAEGGIEDSARRLPTPVRILLRSAGLGRRLDYEIGREPVSPDWLAGMFLVFRCGIFAELGGFDERYFLYCEDADLCTRIKLAGYDVVLDPSVKVVHDARRDSHRNLTHFAYHMGSLAKFFASRVFLSGLRRKGEGTRS